MSDDSQFKAKHLIFKEPQFQPNSRSNQNFAPERCNPNDVSCSTYPGPHSTLEDFGPSHTVAWKTSLKERSFAFWSQSEVEKVLLPSPTPPLSISSFDFLLGGFILKQFSCCFGGTAEDGERSAGAGRKRAHLADLFVPLVVLI